MSAFEELQGKLREIFQLDRNDLDFGLYRIMNLKSQEVTQFIDNDLSLNTVNMSSHLAICQKQELQNKKN